jgi:alpha-L-fucosidase
MPDSTSLPVSSPSPDLFRAHPIEPGPFEPTWESLRRYQVPDWFRDAKLGIWSHWGPQAVPMYGDWYARHMYWEGHAQYLHHLRTYGHPSQHGYKEIVRLWKAERFDPDALARSFQDAGARYLVAQGVHHDNFDNWNSVHQSWNSTKIGPLKDIVGLWGAAARKRGLKFGVSEHLGASFSWFVPAKGADKHGPYAGVPYDGADAANHSLYHDNAHAAKLDPANHWKVDPWYTDDVRWHEQWFKRIMDLVSQHEPDLLYSDGPLPWDKFGLSVVAHLYNLSAKRHGRNEAVYNQKSTDPNIFSIGVLDIERGQTDSATPYPWQNDTSVGDWYYDIRQVYKTPQHVIEILVDCVAKNGNLLLNITQKPDGSLDIECEEILRGMAAWIRVNGEGVYGTRPWAVAIEGPSRVVSGHFKEDAVPWTTADFRFTSKGHTVYAFQMRYPEHREAFIRSLGATTGRRVTEVSVLGAAGPVTWRQCEDGLLVQLPAEKTVAYVPCIKVTLG